jgi:hypothetical protein
MKPSTVFTAKIVLLVTILTCGILVSESLAQHDAFGRMVAALRTSHHAPGTYTVTWNAQDMPSGVYFVRMEAGSFVETRKVVLMK